MSSSGSRSSRQRSRQNPNPQQIPAPAAPLGRWNTDHKKCIPGRKLNFPQHENEIVIAQLRNLRWERIVPHFEGNFHERYVREFYSNLTMGSENNDPHSPFLSSYVNGHQIVLNRRNIATFLNIPDLGECIYFVSSKKELQEAIGQLDFDTYKSTFATTEFVHSDNKRMFETDLLPHLLNLNTFLDANLLPTATTNNSLSTFHQFVLHCIVTGRQLNLPYIIIKTMYDMSCVSTKSLGYGVLLTTMFRNMGLPMDENDYSSLPLPLSSRTLKLRQTHTRREEVVQEHQQQQQQWPQQQQEPQWSQWRQQQYHQEQYHQEQEQPQQQWSQHDDVANTNWFDD